MSPDDVETIAMPSPPSTRGISLLRGVDAQARLRDARDAGRPSALAAHVLELQASSLAGRLVARDEAFGLEDPRDLQLDSAAGIDTVSAARRAVADAREHVGDGRSLYARFCASDTALRRPAAGRGIGAGLEMV